jgi:predicted negative regulator of RcsB-dependent stress response
MVYLGEALLGDGWPAEARAQALRARDLARLRGERGFEALASRLLGEIAARAGERDAAVEAYEAARAAAEALGMRPLAARCRGELARLRVDTQ